MGRQKQRDFAWNGSSFFEAYPELYAALGGASAVPDLRGLFLRGYGSRSHAQNNGSTMGVTDTLHTSGSLGTVQGDAIRKIEGYADTDTHFQGRGYGGALAHRESGYRGWGQASGWGASGIVIDTSRVTPTSSEIRPVNMAVRYLIRALP
jgi:hypothetical protein